MEERRDEKGGATFVITSVQIMIYLRASIWCHNKTLFEVQGNIHFCCHRYNYTNSNKAKQENGKGGESDKSNALQSSFP